MPKQLLPIMDKPLNQQAAEAAIAAGVDTLIFVTGCNKRAIEDCFDANSELETMLRTKCKDAPSNLASIGRCVVTPDIFETLRGLTAGSGEGIQLVDGINIHAQQGSVGTVRLNGRRFDCGSVNVFMRVSNHEYEKRLVI